MRTLRWLLSLMFLVGLASCEEDCESSGDPGGGYCCKVCEDSKACGDSCIATSQTCHQTGGCACNGFDERFYAPVAE